MTPPKRSLWRRGPLLVVATLIAAVLPLAQAADDGYPSKPIRLVYPWGPGGVTDDLARTLAEGLKQRLGQPVVIDYKPGATTIVAASHVARAPADGYTLLFGSAPTFVVNAVTHASLPYDPLKDFAPITRLVSTPFLVASSHHLPVKTLKELIALAKEKPGEISYATPGVGSVPHLAVEKFAHEAGIRLVHVPYNSVGKQMGDLIAGHVSFAFHSQMYQAIADGQVKGLAYTGTRRSGVLSQLPTVGEVLPGYSAAVWFGLAAPAGTPRPIVQKLNTAVHDILRDPQVQARFAAHGYDFSPNSPEDFQAQVRAEIPQWQSLLRAARLDFTTTAKAP